MKEEKKEDTKKEIKTDKPEETKTPVKEINKELSPEIKKEEKEDKKQVEKQSKPVLEDPSKGRRRKLIGIVVSSKKEKTIKIMIEKWHFHWLYKKRIKLKKTMLVHDRNNEAKVGDKVQVIESRPISKLKKWQLVKVVEKAK